MANIELSNAMFKRSIPLERDQLSLLAINSAVYSSIKIVLYFLVIVFLVSGYVIFDYPIIDFFIIIGMGCVFAHGLELQHEALHQNLFRNSTLNRVFGTIFGIPMLVSFTHYKSYHTHHHFAVGTGDDEEIVEYSITSLKNPSTLFLRAWNVMRIPRFFYVFLSMIQSKFPTRIKKNKRPQFIAEYALLAFIFILMIGITIIFRTWAPVILWFAPWLLVSEPMHFVIELPEHLGCDRKTPSILRNTRSYRTNFIWGYFANHNNYHIEHHLWPGVPSHRLHLLHQYVLEAKGHCSSGFLQAIREVGQASRAD
jgi:fatty acid desaturase